MFIAREGLLSWTMYFLRARQLRLQLLSATLALLMCAACSSSGTSPGTDLSRLPGSEGADASVVDTSPTSSPPADSWCDGINLDLAAHADEYDEYDKDSVGAGGAYWTAAPIQALPVDLSPESFRIDRAQTLINMFGWHGEPGLTVNNLKSDLPVVSPVDGCVTRIETREYEEVLSEIDVISKPVEPFYRRYERCNPCRTRFTVENLVPEVKVGQSVRAGERIGHTPTESEGAEPGGNEIRFYVFADDKQNTLCPTALLAPEIIAEEIRKISILVAISAQMDVTAGEDGGYELYPDRGLCAEDLSSARP